MTFSLIRTRADLLQAMDTYGACDPAYLYVTSLETDDARTIGLMCRRRDWLVWFLTRHGVHRTPAFELVVWEAMDRAARVYLPQILARRGLEHCADPFKQLEPVRDRRTGRAAFDWVCALEGHLYGAALVLPLCEVREVREALRFAAANDPGRALDYVAQISEGPDVLSNERELQLSALHKLVGGGDQWSSLIEPCRAGYV